MSRLKRILYAEDDPDIRVVTKLCFEGSGCDIEECKTGVEVLEKVDMYKPQLILLDVMMPVMDGLTTFYKLKGADSSKDIPIIFMTAKVNTKEVEKYHNMGSIGVIYKPFEPNNLINDITAYYQKHIDGKGVT